MATIRKKYLHVCLTPALIDQFPLEGANVVVIDVLRATTSMCVAFDYGARMIRPVAEIETAIQFKEKGYLTAGERNGVKVEGFDFGNSPFDFMTPRVKDANIAMTTTNGTKAIRAAVERGAKNVAVASFPNLSMICSWLREQNENTCLLCSGWKDHPNLEDSIFAGAVARKIKLDFYYYQDTALMAETLFNAANLRKRYFMQSSSHYNRLVHLNLQEEVKYCLRHDTHQTLPILVGDELHDFSKFRGSFADFQEEVKKEQAIQELIEARKKERNVSNG